MMWKEKRVLLLILGLLLAANVAFFFTYRVQYVNRLRDLESQRDDAQRTLTTARNARTKTEQQLKAYAEVQKEIDSIYSDRWATQERRLVPLIIEVRRLAKASDLVPTSYSYGKSESAGVSSTARTGVPRPAAVPPGATVVSIDFSVQGTYEQARRLINLLELSEQFVIIDEVSLSSATGNTLNLTLRLKTLFQDTSTPATVRGRRS